MAKVRVVSYQLPAPGVGILDVQELIAYCARVSNPNNQHNAETSEKLLRYLIKHKHWSPFEMVNICLEIETTRDIARQILRHRSFTFQEFSQRYADPNKSLTYEQSECRLQDLENRQNSLWCSDEETTKWWDRVQVDIVHDAEDVYTQAIRRGIAKEVARKVLPEGLIQSRMYMNGNLRSWMHYCEVRTSPETQKEHREVAKLCIDAIKPIFPMIKEFDSGKD